MRLLAILLSCLLQLCVVVSAISEDEQLLGWHEFHLTIESATAADAVRQYVTEMDFLVADENHLSFPETVIVPPSQVDAFATFLTHQGVKFEIREKDVGGVITKSKFENMHSSQAFQADPSTFFAQTSIIYDWINSLVNNNPTIASQEDIGSSYENRRLVVLKLSTNLAANKPIIFLDAAIHAREWLAPATLNFIIKSFIDDYNANVPEVRALLDKYDWYFQPVVNPDGYDYTFRSSSTRFWRKTRKPYGIYFGADANRNFEYMFGGAGTSNNPSSDIYHGPNAFSEQETKAQSDYLRKLQVRLQRGMFISFHTFGQYWLTPPAYTRVNPPDHADLVRIGNIGRAAIISAGGPSFAVGQTANVGLYEAAGGSFDWVKYRLNVKWCFTLELRPGPGSSSGFAPSPSEIPRSGKEIYAAVKAVANAI